MSIKSNLCKVYLILKLDVKVRQISDRIGFVIPGVQTQNNFNISMYYYLPANTKAVYRISLCETLYIKTFLYELYNKNLHLQILYNTTKSTHSVTDLFLQFT